MSTLLIGIAGDVYIDEIGDRIADYSLLDMTDLNGGIFEVKFANSNISNIDVYNCL